MLGILRMEIRPEEFGVSHHMQRLLHTVDSAPMVLLTMRKAGIETVHVQITPHDAEQLGATLLRHAKAARLLGERPYLTASGLLKSIKKGN